MARPTPPLPTKQKNLDRALEQLLVYQLENVESTRAVVGVCVAVVGVCLEVVGVCVAVVAVCVAVGEGRYSLYCSLCCSVCWSGCGEIQVVLQFVLHFVLQFALHRCGEIQFFIFHSFPVSPVLPPYVCCYPFLLKLGVRAMFRELGPRLWCCASDLQGTMWPWCACCKLRVVCFVKYVLCVW